MPVFKNRHSRAIRSTEATIALSLLQTSRWSMGRRSHPSYIRSAVARHRPVVDEACFVRNVFFLSHPPGASSAPPKRRQASALQSVDSGVSTLPRTACLQTRFSYTDHSALLHWIIQPARDTALQYSTDHSAFLPISAILAIFDYVTLRPSK